MIDHQEDFLRGELQHELDSRRPDRTAMLNRIAANRAGDVRPRGRALRLAGAALAVATVLGIGGVANWALADDHDAAPTPLAPPPVTSLAPAQQTTTATPAPSSPPAAATSATSTTTTTTTAPTPSVSPVRGHPGDTQVEKGSLWSDGSVTAAGQSDVTLKAGADLTELALDIRVTGDLVPGGGIVPGGDGTVTVSVEKQAGAVVYHFVLGEGQTLTAGTYVFSARYGTGARNAAEDTYEAYATSVERKRIHIYGNFLPRE